jgi:hypothetical protein
VSTADGATQRSVGRGPLQVLVRLKGDDLPTTLKAVMALELQKERAAEKDRLL